MSESVELPDDSSSQGTQSVPNLDAQQSDRITSPEISITQSDSNNSSPNDTYDQKHANLNSAKDLVISRYGRKINKTSRHSILHSPVFLGIFGVCFLTIMVWLVNCIISQRQQAPITASVLTYQEIKANTGLNVLVRIQRIDPQKSASCVIQALDTANNEVGRREFLIFPSQTATTDVRLTISTLSPANHASVYACSLTIPSYLHSEPVQSIDSP